MSAPRLLLFALSLLTFGCHAPRRPPLVVEDNTAIVGPNRATTEALGIETLGGVFVPLIRAGTPVPCSVSEVFSTATDDQWQMKIALFRGTNAVAASNHALGRFEVVRIPPAPSGTPQLKVTFTISERQILLSAHDLTRKADLQIQRVAGDAKP